MASRRVNSVILSAAAFIILEVAALCCLAYGSAVRKIWLTRGFTNISAAIWGWADNMHNYFALAGENERLVQDNCDLQRRILEVQARKTAPTLPFTCLDARVVTMTTGSQHNYMILDRGSEDGVEAGDGVITTKGAVGIIQAVSADYAFALSFANENVIVSAKAGIDGSVGSLVWSGLALNSALLGGIPVHKDVAPGDTVYTSGFSAIFPANIPIGIAGEKRINNGSTAEYKVTMLEDLSSLHYVSIVKNTGKAELESLMKKQ